MDKAPILDTMVSVQINAQDQTLEALPVVLEQLPPNAEELPMLVLRLACEVDYTSE